MNQWFFTIVFAALTASLCAAEPALPAIPADVQALSKELQQERMFPRIEISGHFEFAQADDDGTLQPTSSSKFEGLIDLASRQCRFEFKGYRRPVLNAPEPYDVSDFLVIFDGERWLVVRTPHNRAGLPDDIRSLAEVTVNRPAMFLETLEPLCFPLFEQLLELKLNNRLVPLKTILNTPSTPQQMVTIVQSDGMVTLRVKAGRTLEKLVFDPARSHVLVRRDTDLTDSDPVPGQAPFPPGTPRLPKVWKDMVVKELTSVGGLWFPKVAECRKLEDGTVTLQRSYTIDEVTIVDRSELIFPVIPANSLVIDAQSGKSFKTREATPVSALHKNP